MAPNITTDTLTADLCIVGTGYGGRLVAAKAAAKGASVIYVCSDHSISTPSAAAYISRSFIEMANLFHVAQVIAPAFLYEGNEISPLPTPDPKYLLKHIQITQDALLSSIRDEHLRALKINVLTGKAQFQDRKTLIVGNQPVTAKNYVLAPAVKWNLPTIPGLTEVEHLTPDKPVTISRTVEKLIVIGTCGTALALAQAYRRLGAQVILLPLPGFKSETIDDEIMHQVLMSLEQDGIIFKLASPVQRIEAKNNNATIHTQAGESLIGSHVLVAPSQAPCFSDIEMEQAEIQLKGEYPLCDKLLRTSNQCIYIIGAHTNDDIFSVAHEYEANLIVDHALLRRTISPAPETHLIPTAPEIATIGLNEQQARQQYRKIRVLRGSYGLHPLQLARYRQKNGVSGEIKIIATWKERIIGCSIIGNGASDIAGLWSLAITRKLKLQDLSALYFPDLSLHSITHDAADISTFGWQQSHGLWLRLLRLWQKLLGRIGPHE